MIRPVFAVFAMTSMFSSALAHAQPVSNWSTAYCYSDDAEAQAIVYLGNPVADGAGIAAGKRPVILIANIPANQNSFNISGEAKAGYYESHWKTTIAREKTVINMSEAYTGANQPNSGVFMEVSLPVLPAAPQPLATVAGTLTIRLGEDELGFEGTAIGTMPMKCDLR